MPRPQGQNGKDLRTMLSKEDVLADPELLDKVLQEWHAYRGTVRESPIHFVVYDAENRLIAWNDRYEATHPEAFANYRQEIESGQMTYGDLVRFELAKVTPPDELEETVERRVAAIRNSDGMPVDRYYDSVGYLRIYKYLLPNNLVAGIAICINDLVEAKEKLSQAREVALAQYEQLEQSVKEQAVADAKRQRAEARYRSLIDYATEGIIVVDADTGLFVEEANIRAQELYGMTRDELLEKVGPADLSPPRQPDGRPSLQAAMSYTRAALAGDVQHFEWTHRNAKGVDFPCQITLTRFPHPTRRLVRGSIVDLTERKKIEEQRKALERQLAQSHRLELIGQMTGGVAHDFNNMLGVLLGNLELLQERTRDADTASIIQTAIDATEQGAGLTRAMLNYARQAPLKPETFMLGDVVRKMESLISRTIPARISIKTDFSDQNWPITADPSNTESAILNLVLNARDAVQNDGQIAISTASIEVKDAVNPEALEPGGYVMLCVQDNGTGIPSDLLEKIADPFFTTKGIGQNSGLGLSMVQGFMLQSGGHMRVDSTLGVGTTMKLYFPAAIYSAPEADTCAQQKRTVSPSAPAQEGRILLVEDNVSVADFVRTALSRQGFEIVTAGSTDTAIEAFETAGPFDLLVTDIAIPGSMQGPRLAQHFKRSQPRLPVIFISGYSFGLEAQEAGLRETDILLTKPFRLAELVQLVNAAFEAADSPFTKV